MRLLLVFFSACVVLAAVKVAVTALALLFLIALIWGACLYPRQMVGFLTFCTACSVISAHPALSLATAALSIVAVKLAQSIFQRTWDGAGNK